jgi:hypothetical protein
MPTVRQYSIQDVQDDVRALVSKGLVGRKQHIYELCRHFGDRKWHSVEQVLNTHDYLLRDCVIDLIGKEAWSSD